MHRHWLSLIAVVSFACLHSSCIVTDRIEFEERENRPITVVNYAPVNPLQTIALNSQDAVFSMLVWDPDEATNDENFVAKIYITRDSDPDTEDVDTRICEVSGHEPFSEEGIPEVYLNEGNLVLNDCEVSAFYIIENKPVGTRISVRMEVSDLGYEETGELNEGAYTASVSWQYEVVESSSGHALQQITARDWL